MKKLIQTNIEGQIIRLRPNAVLKTINSILLIQVQHVDNHIPPTKDTKRLLMRWVQIVYIPAKDGRFHS
jgi:hypothetical protein